MPYYVVLVKEKGKGNKIQSLPDLVFAPCVGDAWDEASKIVPKGMVLVDVVPQEEKKKKHH